MRAKSGKSSLGDYLSLPKDLSEIQLSSKLESGLDDSQLYLKSEGDLIVTSISKNKVGDEDYSGAALAEHKPHIGKKKLKKLKREEQGQRLVQHARPGDDGGEAEGPEDGPDEEGF